MGCGASQDEPSKPKSQSPLKDNEPPQVTDMTNTIQVDSLVSVGKKVVRGQDWNAGQDDGGPGSPGIVLKVNTDKKIITVKWEKTNKVGDYIYGGNQRTAEGRRTTWKPVYEVQSQVAYNAMADIIGLGAHMPLTKLRENRPSNSGMGNLGVEYPDLGDIDHDNHHDNHHLTFLQP